MRKIIFAVLFLLFVISCSSTDTRTDSRNNLSNKEKIQLNYNEINSQSNLFNKSFVLSIENEPIIEIAKNEINENYKYQEINDQNVLYNFQKIIKNFNNVLPTEIREKIGKNIIFRLFPKFKELIKNSGNQNIANIQKPFDIIQRSGKNLSFLGKGIKIPSAFQISAFFIVINMLSEINNSLSNINQSINKLHLKIDNQHHSELTTIQQRLNTYLNARNLNIKINTINSLLSFIDANLINNLQTKSMYLCNYYTSQLEQKIKELEANFYSGWNFFNHKVSRCDEFIKNNELIEYYKRLLTALETIKHIFYLKIDFELSERLLNESKILNDYLKKINGIIQESDIIFKRMVKRIDDSGLIVFSSTRKYERNRLLSSYNNLTSIIKKRLNKISNDLKSFQNILTSISQNHYLLEVTFDQNRNPIRIRRIIKEPIRVGLE